MSAGYFKPASLVAATIGIALATFMQVLDTSIANVALPSIAGDIGASSQQGTWVITSFTVCNAIALPITGWLSRRFGQVPLFLCSVALFSLTSFLCGISTSMPELVLFRALQGFFAGPLFPLAQTLMIAIYPPAKRSMALALLAMIAVVAPISGPVTGGWLTDNYSWPWIFFINVPIGIIAMGLIWTQLKDKKEPTRQDPIDYVGLALLVLGVGLLQIVLDKGNDLDWFESNSIIVGCAVAVVALVALLIWELTAEHPIIDLRLFRYRNFRWGTIALVLAYSGFFGINLLLPQWLQTQMGYTAMWAGLATAPLGVLPLILAPIVGKYSHRIDMRFLSAGSFIVMATTCFMRAHFNTEVDFYHVAIVQFVMGLGVALFFMPTTTILLSALSPQEMAEGSGLATFLRTLGGSFASSLTTWIWHRWAIEHHAYLTESVSQYDPATQQYMQQLGGQSQSSLAQINQVVDAQAYMLSTVDYFSLLAWVFLALVFVIFMTRPPFVPR